MLISSRWIKVSLLTMTLWCLKPTYALAFAVSFNDTGSHWANQCINELASQRLIGGYSDGSFRPQATLTRAEFAVMMSKVSLPTVSLPTEPSRQALRFNDVPSNHWAATAIQYSYQRGFFSGYPNNQFRPNQPIPRVQAIAILANAVKMSQPDSPEAVLQRFYDDAQQIPAYARKAVAAGTVGRIVTNYPNIKQLRPNQSTTRGEVAALLCQTLRLARTLPQKYIVGDNNLFVIPPEMGGISKFSEGLAVVANTKYGYGYMDTSGTVVIPPQFHEAHVFNEGLAAVRLGEKWGYINRQGQFVIPAQFQGWSGKFSDGLATMYLIRGKIGAIDQEGKWVIAPQSNPIRDFSEGLAAISVNGKYGYIDKTGKIVIEPQFEEAGVFSQGLAPVRVSLSNSESRWGYIDKTGHVVIAPQFYNAQPFSNKLAAVDLAGNQWGYIDVNGIVIIPGKFYTPQYFRYSSDGGAVTPFSPDGVAMARVGEKMGFINRKGEWIIQPTFSHGTDFGDGFARVNSGGIWMQGEADPTPPGGIPENRLYGGVWGYIRVVQ